MQCIRDYNRNYSKNRRFFDNIRNAPFLVKKFWEEVITTHGLLLVKRWQFITYIFGGFFYALSPFDVIPEALFGIIGLIDDAMVWLVFLIGIGNNFLGELEKRNEQLRI